MKKKKIINKDIVIKLLCVLVLIAIIVVAMFYVKRLNTETTEEHSFYQYLGGEKHTYQGVIEISKKQDITKLVCKDIDIVLDSTPIYYSEQEGKVLFPENMALVKPLSNGQMQKIPRFSNCIKDGESVYIQRGEQKILTGNAFIYDGEDLYFFLDTTTVTIGEEVYTLSPLSYITVIYNQLVELYDKSSDMCSIIETNGKDVIATTEDYTINMNVDSMECLGKEQLLLKKIEILQNIN